jgi:hypothetical protein
LDIIIPQKIESSKMEPIFIKTHDPRRSLRVLGHKSDYVVAAPQYRAAANTAMGWKNANLRSEMTRLLRRAGVSGWPRLFHSMRASRQTELQREFPLHVVCSWLGNLAKIPAAGHFNCTSPLQARMCLFRFGPTHDPQTQVLPSWHLVLVSAAIPS